MFSVCRVCVNRLLFRSHWTQIVFTPHWSPWCVRCLRGDRSSSPPSHRRMFESSSVSSSDLPLSVWQRPAAEGRPIGWRCTSCLPSPRRRPLLPLLPRCERCGCSAAAWWSRGIDGARNDEEMRGGDGQQAKIRVALLGKCEERKRRRRKRSITISAASK